MSTARFVSALGLALSYMVGAGGADTRSYVVVVNDANPNSVLAPAEIARVFQKTVRRWDNGVAIEPVDQSFQSAIRLSFSQEILGRTPGQMQEYWLRETYSGRDVPPPVRPSDTAVLEFIRSSPGGIGYVSASVSLPPGVKALSVAKDVGANSGRKP
jgi:ABC-type phosphate transport system substrate-binding protein